VSKSGKAPASAPRYHVDPEVMLAAALDYAELGYRVHPLKAGTKIPRLDGWPELATLDEETIRGWWRKWPHANIGIATGKASDLWVLDVDLGSHRAEAQETMAGLSELGELGEALVVNTPSGGVHYWYRWPKGKGNWTNSGGGLIRVNGGVDVRAEGGQVAAAPSVITHDNKGKPYEDESGATMPRRYSIKQGEPKRPPGWLAKLTKAKPVATDVALGTTDYDVEGLTTKDKARIASYLETATTAIATDLDALRHDPAAQWDNEVFVKAQRLVDLANAPWSTLTLEAVRGILLKHSPRDDGFPEGRILAKLDSAIKRATAVLPLPITPQPELATFDYPEELRPDPDTFFNKQTGLLSERLAYAIDYDLALGIDGSTWAYGAGVWISDDDEIERRVIRALGDRYRREHAGIARSVITKGGTLPVLPGMPSAQYVNTLTGMLDWKSGKLIAHDPNFLSTVQLSVNYDAGATCPRFDAWLAQVVDADTVALIWETIGYLFMSGNPLHRAVLLVGNGRNGKGTLLRVVTSIMGKRKLANIAGDIEARSLTNTAKFKAFTGGDSVLAQHKHARPFEFTPWAVPIFSANQLWQSSDNTDGYLDRWLVLPFNVKVAREASGKFDESALIAEGSGIFNKAMAALRELMARGDFELSGKAAEVKRRFELEADIVKIWLEDDEHIVAAEAGNDILRTGRTVAYKRFAAWASDSGHGVLNASNFYRRLERMGYLLAKSGGTRLVLGIKLDVSSPYINVGNTHAEVDD
jgi:putative DNA primase/helicase